MLFINTRRNRFRRVFFMLRYDFYDKKQDDRPCVTVIFNLLHIIYNNTLIINIVISMYFYR